MTIHAIYENGVFRPTEPVALPEASQVEFEPRVVAPAIGKPDPQANDPESIAAWIASLKAFVATRPNRAINMDDSRDTIYGDDPL